MPGPIARGWQTYVTVNAGTFTFPANSYHTVRIEFLAGSMNVNYWTI
ncbi:carbohydrate-binding domain-containing protein [Kibdelosporangium aridum]